MSEARISSLRKNFGSYQAIKGIDLDVMDGEFLTFLGPSGCGKSTMLRMLAGYIYPDSGEIFLRKENVTYVSPSRRNIGMVFQNFALFPHMSVFDNIAFGLDVRKVAATERKKRVNEALDLVRLSGLGDRYPRELSGGQQQRVALARAIVIKPSLLLLDEPLSALDLKLRQDLQIYIKDVQKQLGITTIYVTHDQGEALRMSDRIAVMSEGEIIQIGSPLEIYSKPNSNFVAKFIGEMNVFGVEGLSTAADGASCTVGSESNGNRTILKAKNVNAPSSAPSGKLAFGVRPEAIEFDGSGENSVTGTVSSIQYSGSLWTITVAVPDAGDIDIEIGGSLTPPALGTRQRITWHPDDSFIFSD